MPSLLIINTDVLVLRARPPSLYVYIDIRTCVYISIYIYVRICTGRYMVTMMGDVLALRAKPPSLVW